MEDVGKACVLICLVMRSANGAERLNLLESMLDVGFPENKHGAISTMQSVMNKATATFQKHLSTCL